MACAIVALPSKWRKVTTNSLESDMHSVVYKTGQVIVRYAVREEGLF